MDRDAILADSAQGPVAVVAPVGALNALSEVELTELRVRVQALEDR